ncbi:MAG: hypothetical protein CML33_06275 [Rhodobacteraceae bacterium]|nr:hypothetical protein [Paracoccaceae bacterium]
MFDKIKVNRSDVVITPIQSYFRIFHSKSQVVTELFRSDGLQMLEQVWLDAKRIIRSTRWSDLEIFFAS